MKQIDRTLILVILACILVAMASSLFWGKAEGYANFTKWANRSDRVLEPGDYNTNGTCSCAICSWKGVRGIGNMGIGDGNISTMKPALINEMTQSSMDAMNSNASSGETANETAVNKTPSSGNYSDSIIRAPESNSPGNGSLVTQNADIALEAPVAPAAEGPVTESLYPDYDLAGSILPRCTPYSITIGKPFAHIMAEDPCEAAALYGKLIGVPMPGGQIVDVGIKSIGYEY